MIKDLHATISRCEYPTILCLQAGNVNTGAFDSFEEIIDFTHSPKIWVYVDGVSARPGRRVPHDFRFLFSRDARRIL